MNHLKDDYGIQLIGISGNAGSGKDTVAEYIQEIYIDVWAEAFAGPLKAACSAAFGIPLIYFYSPVHKETTNEYWNVSPRQIAQYVGTELFRDAMWKLLPELSTGFWRHRLFAKLSGLSRNEDDGEYTPGDTVIIPDVRFKDEFEWVLQQGGIVICLHRETATGNVGIPGHVSEQIYRPLDPKEGVYHVNNNGTIDELQEQIRFILQNCSLTLTAKSIVNNL